VGFLGCQVTRDFFGGKLGEMDKRGFDETAALGVGQANESDTRYDGMGAAGKAFEHMTRVVAGSGLSEDAAIESYDSVCGENDGGTDGACGGKFCFGVGEALDEVAGGFAGNGCFVDGGSDDGEGEAGVVENFGAARRGGSEEELHVR